MKRFLRKFMKMIDFRRGWDESVKFFLQTPLVHPQPLGSNRGNEQFPATIGAVRRRTRRTARAVPRAPDVCV